MAEVKKYDVVIIGGGPAGLSAAVYAGRAMAKTLIIEGEATGGQIIKTAEIENYPGQLESESGYSLCERMLAQAQHFGAELVYDNVVSVELEASPKRIVCSGAEYEADKVIIATGASPAKIGCPGEAEFTGMGVSYCATCDGAFFRNLPIYVVGGGDSAVEEAMFLTRFSKNVTVIHRRDELRAAKSIQEKAFATDGLSFMWNTKVAEIGGKGALTSIIVEDTKTGERRELTPGDARSMGVFVFIGLVPNSALFPASIKDERGYIKTNEEMETSIPGVYAVGDIRVKSLRQVVTAAADGAIAAFNATK